METVKYQIDLLGPFTVTICGIDVTPSGLPAELLAMVALNGALHYEVCATYLWPDASYEVGQVRLRNVLSRLRSTCGPIIVRDRNGMLACHALTDSRSWTNLASLALETNDEVLAARLARAYRPLLPWCYSEWALERRNRLEATYGALLLLLPPPLAYLHPVTLT